MSYKGLYIKNLDGVRALAVLLVVLSHYGFGDIIPGGLGVTMFFFLSGFLITTLLLVELRKTAKISLGNFFIRRALRLMPPLVVVLVLSYLGVALGLIKGEISISSFLYQLFYLANYNLVFSLSDAGPDGLGILWSLSVEEHFYLIFPLAFMLLINKGENFFSIVVFVMLISVLLWRYYLIYNLPEYQARIYYSTDTRFDSILYGVLFALRFNPIFNSQHASRGSSVNKEVVFCLIVFLVFIFVSLLYRNEAFRMSLRFSMQGVSLMFLFYVLVKYPDCVFFKFLESWPLKKIGIYSYSIYLFHLVIYSFLNEYLEEGFALLFISFFVTVIISYLIDKYIDNYAKKLKKKII